MTTDNILLTAIPGHYRTGYMNVEPEAIDNAANVLHSRDESYDIPVCRAAVRLWLLKKMDDVIDDLLTSWKHESGPYGIADALRDAQREAAHV